MERGTGAAPSREEPMMSWEREQEEYQHRREDAIDMAYLLAWAIFIAVLVAELDYLWNGIREAL